MTEACISLEIDCPRVLSMDRVYLNLEVKHWWTWTKLLVHEMKKKQSPAERSHLTCIQLKLLTEPQPASFEIRSRSGVLGRRVRQTEELRTTPEGFSRTRVCQRVEQKTLQIAKMLHVTRRSIVQWLRHRRRNGLH